jgi:dTDP-glucose 4,6-dehydratase
VSDNVEGIWRLLRSGYGDPVNIGNPVEMTILAFAEAVQRHVGSHVPIVHRPLPQDDPRVRRPDITRAGEVLGWAPRVDFEEGMRLTVPWFRERVAAGR